MLGSSIMIGSGANTLISTVTDIPDDVPLGIGDGSDGVILNRSTTLTANTALTGVLIGTPDVDALAANSLIISNITADGDMVFAINDGGTSKSLIWLDGSDGTLNFPLGATLSGDLTLGANKIKLQAVTLKGDEYGTFYVRNLADTADAGFFAAIAYVTSAIYLYGNGLTIAPQDTDDYSAIFKARDNTVAQVEIARLMSAADPYFRIGRDDTGVALNAVTDMLILQAGGLTGNEAANFGLGTSWRIGNAASEVEERGSIDLVLNTATNGSEDAQFNFNVMAGGAMVAPVLSISGTAITPAVSMVIGTLDIDDDSGAVTLVDMGVTADPADGTEESIAFAIDGNIMLKLYSEADSAGAVDTMSVKANYPLLFNTSNDSAAVADTITLSGYEIGAGNRVLAIGSETAVAAEADETKFSAKLQCRINGANYYIMLCET